MVQFNCSFLCVEPPHGARGSFQRALERYLKVYGLVDALVHRHIFAVPYAKSDEELVRILTDLSVRVME